MTALALTNLKREMETQNHVIYELVVELKRFNTNFEKYLETIEDKTQE